MKEITFDDVKNEEQKIDFIENPLPVPKRREHREMDYSLSVDENDDYDIKYKSGKEIYDIE